MNTNNNLPEQFNGVALVAEKDDLKKLAQGYCDYQTKEELQDNHHFYICSISKMFASIAINQLVDQKVLTKQDSIAQYLGEYIKDNDITIYHLLTHTSGLPNYVMYRKELDWQKAHTEEEIMRVVMSKKRKFKAGTKWSYSNTGYYLLALIIEKVTKMSYEEYITKQILQPLGMNDTGFSSEVFRLAKPHIKDGEGYVIHPTLLKGAGDIISILEDMHRFAKAFYQGELISKARYTEMITPVFEDMKVKYGEGIFVSEHFGMLSIGHSGSMPTGYSTQLSIYPDVDTITIVLGNNRKCIHPLVYPDANGKYIEGYLAEQIFNQKISIWKKAYI
ncbi:MAG: serine hydrolase domain-containing protein [Cellulosilyticaceae bacterium]